MSSEEEPIHSRKEEDLGVPAVSAAQGMSEMAKEESSGTQEKKEAKPRKVACIVKLEGVTLKLTLSAKLLEKPLDKAVITPFLGAYNKKKSTQVAADALECVTIDGFTFKANLPHLATAPCGSLFTSATHEIELHRSVATPDISDNGAADNATTAATAATSNNAPAAAAAATSAVERVIAAKHEFEILELPLAPQSQSAVRKAYRKVSLSVHPDKVDHPKASEAFRRTFDAMKLLLDASRQSARLKQIERGEADDESDARLPAETRWWDAATVSEMEQAFHNLEEVSHSSLWNTHCTRTPLFTYTHPFIHAFLPPCVFSSSRLRAPLATRRSTTTYGSIHQRRSGSARPAWPSSSTPAIPPTST